jgi:transcriptional regulator with XRE-family HTH domain
MLRAMRRSTTYTSSRAVPSLRRTLGPRIRELRSARGLSQEVVGRGAKISPKFIGEVERGEKSISLDTLHRVAAVLKVPMRELLDQSPEREGLRPAEADELSGLLEGCDERTLRRAREVLVAMFGRSRKPLLRRGA